ncbi:N-formylglutamate amidohydrolase [Marinovum sp.]|uniref:N-formylglutamate amidohydrolase n=1 Tax=Marinovum sp. TaxID=2024839 RepID=UPI002B276F05|nr:N-formylglutamate amidohydrolase [Marinovum sp.]
MSDGRQDSCDATVCVTNAAGAGGVVLLCEHAASAIPARYGDLGLRAEWRESHAAWDPGALALSHHLSQALDAPLVSGCVSRLVYDINRPPEAAAAMPVRSELVEIPGNANLTEAQREERIASVYRPFCEAVAALLDARARAIVTVHSFTPVFFGKARPTEIGILHDADARLAEAMLAHAPTHRRVDRNMPYGPEDGVTHSLRLHALPRKLPNVMLEVRNDLLTTPEDIATLAEELLAMLRPALAAVPVEVSHA